MDATLKGCSVRRVRQGLVALVLGMSAWAGGCHTLDNDEFKRDCGTCTDCQKPSTPPPPTAPAAPAAAVPTPGPAVPSGPTPAEASVYFEHSLKIAPDTEHDGQNQPGLVGRLYLFDRKLMPICHDGSMVIKVFDEKPAQGGGEVFLEQWNFDKDSLRKLQQKDAKIGWGYTVFLPTVTCTNPNVKNIRVMVVYTPEPKGSASITVASTMRLEHPEARGRAGQPTASMPQGMPAQYAPQLTAAPVGYMQQQPMDANYPQHQVPMQYAPQQTAPVYQQQPMMPQQQMPPQYAPQQPAPMYQQQQMVPQQQVQYTPPQSAPVYQQPMVQQQQMPSQYAPQQPAPMYQQQALPLPQQPIMPPLQSHQGLQQATVPQDGAIPYPPQAQQPPAPFPATPTRPLGFQN